MSRGYSSRIQEELKRYWPLHVLRAEQQQAIDAIVLGKDVLLCLPTGAGKSLCYQLGGLLQEGLCLVISPLVALMRQQVGVLSSRGLKAAALEGSLPLGEQEHIMGLAYTKQIKYLFITPERLLSPAFLRILVQMSVGLWVVDEAHCISMWGHDFRLSYRKLHHIRKEKLLSAPCMALSATAREAVRKDIMQMLLFRKEAVCITASLRRPMMHYEVYKTAYKKKALTSWLQAQWAKKTRKKPLALIYVRSRRRAEYWANALSYALPYHAGLSYALRQKNLHLWQQQQQPYCLVATAAFGMGVHIENVACVAHIGLPQNVETYYQESGRAGRDGKEAASLILYNERDVSEATEQLSMRFPPMAEMQQVYQALANYYQIAIGSDSPYAHPFSQPHFIKTYKLAPLQTHYILQRLVQAEKIRITAYDTALPRIRFLVPQKKLYEQQLHHPQAFFVCQALLRDIGGSIFSSLCEFDAKKIAQKAHMSLHATQKTLHNLHKARQVCYLPPAKTPLLTFLSSREKATQLSLPADYLQTLKQQESSAFAQLIDYLHAHTCREQTLLHYFGEKSADCGKCDNCNPSITKTLP